MELNKRDFNILNLLKDAERLFDHLRNTIDMPNEKYFDFVRASGALCAAIKFLDE